jgi:lysozyme
MTFKGIDVSHYQGKIEFSKVKNSGIDFVFVKATEGTTYLDPMFETNFAGANNAGLYVGAYHFGRFSNSDEAVAEAKFFLSKIKGKTFTYPVVLDLEVDKKQVSTKELTDAAIAFLEQLEKAGYFAMIYSGKYFFEKELEPDRLKPYAQWLARYGSSELGRDAGIWQYSSSGNVDGIPSGSVDMNIAYYDYHFVSPKSVKVETVKVIKESPKPTPKPTPKKTPLPNPGLKYGSTGSSVVQLQNALNKLNFKCGTADGSFGPKTEDALKRFQSVYCNPVDGVFGAKTKAAMEKLLK